MPVLRPLLRRLIIVFFVALLLLAAAGWLALYLSLPTLQGDLRAGDLQAPATIERDALGTATIRASSRLDAAYALGFEHGQERFFEMDLMRRSAAGELSALVGKVALNIDKAHRQFRMRERAQRTLHDMPVESRALLARYRDGVNAGLSALSARPWEYWLLRSRPQPWTEADSLLVIDAMSMDLNDSTNARELAFSRIRAALGENVYKFLATSGGPWDAPLLGPPMPYPTLPSATDIDLHKLDPKLLQFPPERSQRMTTPGSNGFAVNGALTGTHSALVANDMHLRLRVPNIWFRARIEYPNPRRAGQTTDLIGVTLPGVPLLIAGSNRHIAWGFTNSYGDWLDWVRVDLDPSDPERYRTADGWRKIHAHKEIIKVRGGKDVTINVRDTEWGPILAKDVDDTPLALAWTALRPGGVNIELAKMDTAETVDEAMEIANRAGMPPQNFIVGDHAGNIGWSIAGRIPIRIGNYDPLLPSDWSKPDTGWAGWYKPSDYPRLPNPPSNRIWTANARTMDWGSPDFDKLGDGGYDLGARARQIRDDLKRHDQFVPDDMLTIQLDDRALLLAHWHDNLNRVIDRAGTKSPLARLKPYLADWDGQADTKSVAYRIVRDYRNDVLDTVLDGFAAAVRVKYPDFKLPKIPQAETLVDDILVHAPMNLLPPGYSDWNDLQQQCAQRVMTTLAARPGGLAKQTWGARNTTDIRHPLSPALPGFGWLLDMPAHELPGDSNMPRVQTPNFGASERFAVSPGYEQFGYFHMPGGQSDNPLSPFHDAGYKAWMQGKATPFLPGVAKYTLRLVPTRPTH